MHLCMRLDRDARERLQFLDGPRRRSETVAHIDLHDFVAASRTDVFDAKAELKCAIRNWRFRCDQFEVAIRKARIGESKAERIARAEVPGNWRARAFQPVVI